MPHNEEPHRDSRDIAVRIVIFDDDDATGYAMSRVATAAGLKASFVTRPADFQASLEPNLPDIVMLDLHLGTSDGIDQLGALAARAYGGSIILISGFDQHVLEVAANLARSLKLRVEGVLRKPIAIDELNRIFARLQAARKPVPLPVPLVETASPPSVQELFDAIRNGELRLHLQPIVSRRPNVLQKLEALVRWQHPSLGYVRPDSFIPVAEANPPLMAALTDQVISDAITCLHALKGFGLTVPISVNVAISDLLGAPLSGLGARLQASGIAPNLLCLEVTERVAAESFEAARALLLRLRLQGVSVSIDDFGTGHSTLKLLRQLPFSEIKIDRSFVGDLIQSRDSRAIVKSIVGLAADLGVSCVAEGVESEEAAGMLEQLHVNAMQGFLFGKGMPVGAIPAWLAAWHAVQ